MASATSEAPSVPPAVDFVASPVQGQLGSTIMDLNGQVVQQSGLLAPAQASLLYKMLLEVGILNEEGAFRTNDCIVSVNSILCYKGYELCVHCSNANIIAG